MAKHYCRLKPQRVLGEHVAPEGSHRKRYAAEALERVSEAESDA